MESEPEASKCFQIEGKMPSTSSKNRSMIFSISADTLKTNCPRKEVVYLLHVVFLQHLEDTVYH